MTLLLNRFSKGNELNGCYCVIGGGVGGSNECCAGTSSSNSQLVTGRSQSRNVDQAWSFRRFAFGYHFGFLVSCWLLRRATDSSSAPSAPILDEVISPSGRIDCRWGINIFR